MKKSMPYLPQTFARKWVLAEHSLRSLVKAVSWRLVGSLDTFVLSWLITGHAIVAVTITSVEFFTKIALYWLHERVWLHIPWGNATNIRKELGL